MFNDSLIAATFFIEDLGGDYCNPSALQTNYGDYRNSPQEGTCGKATAGLMAELKGHYADRLWDAWKDYEKTHGALSGVELAARVQRRVGGIFDDTKLSRIRHKKRRATVEELIALSEELEVSFLWLARGRHTELPLDDGVERERVLTRRKRHHRRTA